VSQKHHDSRRAPRTAPLACAIALAIALTSGPALARDIGLITGPIDTDTTPPTTTAALGAQGPGDEALVLIQFDGAIEDAWLDQLQLAGVTFHHYVPGYTYVATIAPATLPYIRTLPHVAWIGALPGNRKIHPNLFLRAMSAIGAAVYPPDRALPITILSVNSDIVQQLQSWGLPPTSGRASSAGWYETRVRVPTSRLMDIAGVWSVFYVELQPEYELHGERAAQTAAGNFTPGAAAPVGPGYAAFLTANGLSGGPGLVAQIQDDGLDQGDASNLPGTAHPDIVGRITGIFNATSDPLGDSLGGHGQINAGIVMGNAAVGTTDADGYRLGQGMAPAASVYGTKIFRNTGTFDIGGNTFSSLAKDAQDAGVIISNNSWGAPVGGAYNANSAEFDLLTRDADPTEPGHQPIIYFFSAGNSGSGANTVGAPGTAKNVITVGAAENSDMDGVDGCGIGPTGANNLNDLISFSSRGPNDDGRRGVTVVSVGTHNQGPASTAPGYTGGGVCDQFWPSGQTDYARSSGTSHSTPTAAGLGLVIYELFQTQLAPLGHTATPSPALMKAVLTTTATDLAGGSNGAGGTLGNVPSTEQGWGSVNLANLLSMTQGLTTVDQTEVFTSSGQSFAIDVTPLDPSQPVKITLAWTDAPAVPLANPTLVNDLDLVVTDGPSTYLGNVFSLGSSVTGGTADSLNNLESVFIQSPTLGQINIQVNAANIVGDGLPGVGGTLDQDFALFVWNGLTQSPRGVVHFLRDVSCADTGNISLSDADLRGAGTQSVSLSSAAGDAETLVLTEEGSSGVFLGSLPTAAAAAVPSDGVLQVADGGLATVTYNDADDGTGAPAVATHSSIVDCTPPVLSNIAIIDVTSSTATAQFDTNESASGEVDFGTSCGALTQNSTGASGLTAHSFGLTSLTPDTTYYLTATATDPAGNVATDDNVGASFSFTTLAQPSNLGFELGDFTNWVPQDLSVPFLALQVGGAGISPGFGLFVSAPTEGSFAALHGFDGNGPGTIVLATDVSLPSTAESIGFDYRAGWNLLSYGAVLDRSFSVDIEPLGGGAALQSDLILTATAGTVNFDTGNLSGAVDVTAFAGQDVRLSFEWSVTENYSGPAFFQLDAVAVVETAVDSDGDGVLDPVDNCVDDPNPAQIDTDQDGYGNLCDPDFDDDGVVGGTDFSILANVFNMSCSDPEYDAEVDLNSDCAIGGPDFSLFVHFWAGAPGPSGYACAGTAPCP